MQAADQAACLIALVVCLGACLICAIYELERFRTRRKKLARMTELAMQTVDARKERSR